jgi:hypothetical protein
MRRYDQRGAGVVIGPALLVSLRNDGRAARWRWVAGGRVVPRRGAGPRGLTKSTR